MTEKDYQAKIAYLEKELKKFQEKEDRAFKGTFFKDLDTDAIYYEYKDKRVIEFDPDDFWCELGGERTLNTDSDDLEEISKEEAFDAIMEMFRVEMRNVIADAFAYTDIPTEAICRAVNRYKFVKE